MAEKRDDTISNSMMSGFEIKRSEVTRWLKIIYTLSGGTPNLQNAIVLAKYGAMTEDEIEIANGMGMLYRAQCSGSLIPPVKLNILYLEIIEKEKGAA